MAGFLAAAGLIGGAASAAGHGLADSHKRAGDVGGADVVFTDSVIWELYAATGVDAVPIRFAGSYQRDDTGETVAVEVVMRGRQKEIDTGEGKQGEDTESKISVVCTYFRLTMDGKELVEIDTINMIEKVNGVDRLEQHRRNIGL